MRDVMDTLLRAERRRVGIARRDDQVFLEVQWWGDGDLSWCVRIPLSEIDVERLRRELAAL